MFEIYFLIGAIVLLNLYTHDKINKDDAYFLDEEKLSYIEMVWYLPLVGSIIAQYRLHADKTFYMTVMGIFFLLRYGIYYLFYVLF
jgi:hypothetical protein